MKYFSTKTYEEVEIDIATAGLGELLDAYNSLFAQANSGGAFPGSAAWKKAKTFRDQLAELTSARPEIVEYRKSVADAARAARLANTYID